MPLFILLHASAVAQGTVVSAMSASFRKTLHRNQTLHHTNTKIGMVNKVANISKCANFYSNRLNEGAPTHT
jgi:hypothetical protein